MEDKTKFRIAAGCFLVIIVPLVIASMFSVDDPQPQRTSQTKQAISEPSQIRVCYMIQTIVESKLKSPYSAEFPPCIYTDINKIGRQYNSKSYVDSQNGFGAMIRTEYVIVLTWIGEDNFRLDSLLFDD